MAEQPTGTVTLLFTDIEGSTRLLEHLGAERYSESLELHRRLLREAFDRHGGYEVDNEGDAFFVAFRRAADAAAAAMDAQRALAAAAWPEQPLRVRMGMHTGEPMATPPKYVGLDVHKAARVMAAGHGGQVLLTRTTREMLGVQVPVRELGTHRLKDLSQPEPLYQLRVPGLRDEFPALKTLGNRPNNLPVVATPFIGRERELAAVHELRLGEAVRLLTLTGTGGIGKTRLGLQAAAEMTERFRDGVFWVPLAPLRAAALVGTTVAQALGLREEPGEPIVETLVRYLGEKQLLLLLDNLEHLVGEARVLVAELLRVTPGVSVLATSREALRISGEQVYDVPPLAVPDEVAALQQNDAVQLFASRARAADATFAISDANASAIVEIVRRLEGLPLAIELAAARTRTLPPLMLLERLGDRFRLLSKGTPDADERQRTLRATIEWSYDLLTQEEQSVYARLGIFVGGCRLDAAEAVCDPDATLGIDVLDAIESLLEKSLVRRRDDADGRPRYWMLETLREHALATLGADAEVARQHHAAFFADVARQVAASFSAGQREFPPFLDADRANLRAAMTWSAEQAPELAATVAIAYGLLCALRGPIGEGRQWLSSVLDAGGEISAGLRCDALRGLASLAERQGDIEAGRAAAIESVNLARHLDDELRLARSLMTRGLIEYDAGDPALSEKLQRDALLLFERIGSEHDARIALGMLGFLLIAEERNAEAAEVCERALQLSRAAEDKRGVAVAASNLGHVRAREGATDEALVLQREALQLLNEMLDLQGVAEVVLDIAALAIERGENVVAATLLGGIPVMAESGEFALVPHETIWYEDMVARLERDLGDDGARAALAHGARAGAPAVVACASSFVDRALAPSA